MIQRKTIYELLREKPFHNKPVVISTHRKTDDVSSKQLFMEWVQAESFVQLLENIRDANTPKTPEEEWNLNFCTAVEMLPEAKQRAKDCWLDYYTYKGQEI